MIDLRVFLPLFARRLEAETQWAKSAGQKASGTSSEGTAGSGSSGNPSNGGGSGGVAATGVATPILYRAFPNPWSLYSKPAVGAPRLLAVFPQVRSKCNPGSILCYVLDNAL